MALDIPENTPVGEFDTTESTPIEELDTVEETPLNVPEQPSPEQVQMDEATQVWLDREAEAAKQAETAKEDKRIDEAVKEMAEVREVDYQSRILDSEGRNPDQQTEIQSLSKEFNTSPSFIQGHLKEFQAARRKKELSSVTTSNPNLAKWVQTTDQMALIKDDLDGVKEVDTIAGRFKFKDPEESAFSAFGRGLNINKKSMYESLLFAKLMHAKGEESQSEIIDDILKVQGEINTLTEKDDKKFKEAQALFNKEGTEVDDAWGNLVDSFSEFDNDEILSSLSKIGGESADFAGEGADLLWAMSSNVKAQASLALRSSLNSVAPWVVGAGTGLAGSYAGAATGAAIGSVTGPGALIAGGIGAGIGFAGGAVVGSGTAAGFSEYMSSLKEVFQENNAITNTREGLLALANNPKLVEQAQSESIRKALATGAIEGLTTFLVGKTLLKAAKGPVKGLGKAKEVGKALALEATGEGVGATFAPAVQKLDIREAKPGQGAQEAAAALISMGTIGAVTYVATGNTGITKVAKDASTKIKTKMKQAGKGYVKAQEATEFNADIIELAEAGKLTKLKERNPEAHADLMNSSSDSKQVFMQADDWNDHWTKQGENPVEKADELLPGGRADLDKAKTLNHPVQFPIGDLVSKFSEEESFSELASLIKSGPLALNLKQSETITANIPAMLQDLSKEAKIEQKRLITREEEVSTIEKKLEGQYREAGVDVKEAKADARIYRAMPEIASDILGISIKEADDLVGIDVVGVEAKGIVAKAKKLFQKEGKDARGSFDPIARIVSILKDANKSTPLHEMGHAFFESMRLIDTKLGEKDVEIGPTQLKFKEDVATVLDHFNVESFDDISTENHENFARLFETYLQEGKAPTKELQSVFTAFRTWLVAIYRNARGVARAAGQDLNLTPEMKEVFDRLVATEDEINQTSEDMGYSREEIDSFTELPNIKDSADIEKLKIAHEEAREEATLQLYQEQLKQLKKKQTKEYKARARTIKADIQARADEMPLYVAVDSIKANEVLGSPSGFDTLKMNTERVKEMLTPEEFKAFPKSLYSASGIDPNITADYLGFENGKDIITQISNNPSKVQFVEQATQLQLDTEFPNFMSPFQQEELKVEAIDAVTNDKRAKALKLELDILFNTSPAEVKTLIKKISKRLPTNKDVRSQAERQLNASQVKEIKPSLYRSMETKSRREAGVLAAKGDILEAFNMKVRELLNYQLGRTASDMEAKMNSSLKKNRKRFSKSDKDLKKKGNPEIMKAAQSILASFGMITDVQVERINGYMDQLKKYDMASFEKVQGLTEALVDIQAVPYQELTVEEFNQVTEVVDSLYHIGVEDDFITVDGVKVKKAEAIPLLNSSVAGMKNSAVLDDKSRFSKFKIFANSTKANMTRVEHWINNVDKEDIQGAWNKFVWNRANDGQTEYDLKFAERYKTLTDITKKNFKDIFKDNRKVDISKYFKGIDPQLSQLNRSEVIMAMVHSGNDSNKRKLLLGRGWGSLDVNGKLVTTNYDTFMSDMFDQGFITKENMDGVQAMWDMFEDYKPEMQKTHKEIYGTFFKEIEPAKVETPYGTYAGGYAPAMTDKLLVPAQAIRENAASTETSANQFARAHTPTGMTKHRVDEYNRALSLDFDILQSAVESSTRFTVLEPVVNDLNKIIHNRDVIESIHTKNKEWNPMLSHWLARLATQSTGEISDTPGGRQFDSFLRTMRSASGAQLMFLNVKNTIENLTDLPAIATKVGGRKLMANMMLYMQHQKATTQQIEDLSPGVSEMLKSNIHEIRSTYRTIKNEGGFSGKFKDLQALAAKHTYILQQALDNVMRIAAYKTAFDEGMLEFKDQKIAARHAERVLALTMGRNRPIDISKIETGGELQKSVMMFYSYFNNRANLVLHSQKEDLPTTYMLGVATPAILSSLLARAFRGDWGDEEDDGKLAVAADVLFGSQVRYLAATVPGLGGAARLAEGLVNDKPYDDKLSISPMVGMFESMKGGINLLKQDDLRSRDVSDSMMAFGTMFRLPLGGLRKPVKYLIDVEQGKQSADSPTDIVKGLVTGKSE